MKILKYKKKSNGTYQVELEDRKLILYEEVILKNQLLLKKELLESELEEIEKDHYEWQCYYEAIHSLKSRLKSISDMRDFLKKKNYPDKLVSITLDKLEKQGFLNDSTYASSYIHNQMVTSNKGPLKIANDLIYIHHVDSIIVNSSLSVYDEETEKQKIQKNIERMIHMNKNKGGSILKKKIYQELVSNGYHDFLINSILSQYTFSISHDMIEKEKEKLYRKYQKKYEGKLLEQKVKEGLYKKGLYKED